MGLNATGRPNPNFYVLGRGRLLLAENDTSTGLPSAYRHLGNAPAFATTVEVEEFTHRSSLSGFSEVDARAITSREIGLSFSLDELSFDNLGLFFNGTTEELTNPAVAGVSASADTVITTNITLGMWYQLLTKYDGTGNPVSIDPANTGDVTIREDPAGTPVTLTEGTDYELDPETGFVFFPTTAVSVMNGDTVDWAVTAQMGAPANIDRVKALEATNKEYSLQFISVNPLNSDEEIVYEFHRVSLSADGDMNLIQENEAAVAQFSGTALKNSNIGSTGATLTVRGL